MQFIALPRNLCKLYTYVRTQKCLEFYRKRYEEFVNTYQLLKDEGNDPKVCYALSGISRATFFRYKKILKELQKGINPPSKKPKHLRQREWGEADFHKVPLEEY